MDLLVRRRTAVTERDAGTEPTVCARWGMGRILIVPLFGAHGVAGSLNLVRPEGAPAFSGQDQLTALALSAQTSVALARCEGTPVTAEAAGLTQRERELLRLLGRDCATARSPSDAGSASTPCTRPSSACTASSACARGRRRSPAHPATEARL
jgi:hypothetical protein